MTVGGGTVAGNTASLSGNIVNNALVVFDQSSAGTYAGAMSGSGVLGKTGAGALTLTGANTYTGGTLLSAGSIIGTTTSLQGNFVNNGELIFDQPGDGTFQGAIFGSGAVTKQGTGLVTINGANGFTGLTQVLGGTLAIDAGLPGDVLVGPNGLLHAGIGGSSPSAEHSAPGTSLATFNAGRLGLLATAPNQAPSLFVNGNFTTTPGSSLDMTVSPSGAPPIVVTGTANLELTHLNVTINDPNPARNATYVALTAGQGLTTSGVTASSPTTGLVPIVKGDSNALMLTLLNLQVVPDRGVDEQQRRSKGLDGQDGRRQLDAVVPMTALATHLSRPCTACPARSASTLRLTSMLAGGDEDASALRRSTTRDARRSSGRSVILDQLAADHSSFHSNGSSGLRGGGGGGGLNSTDPALDRRRRRGPRRAVVSTSAFSQLTAPLRVGLAFHFTSAAAARSKPRAGPSSCAGPQLLGSSCAVDGGRHRSRAPEESRPQCGPVSGHGAQRRSTARLRFAFT
jgi:autotransporter-associated beta strand protein